MVTFSIPGDNDDAPRGTPRQRPQLAFSKRAHLHSPYGTKRLGTPQSAPARRLLNTRDDLPSSGLNKSSIATARNIFRASSISDSPPVATFSPSLNLPPNTPNKVFAPGATPEPSRVYRASTAQATPRGMAAKATSKELFPMRIEDPDPELSGEVLTNKIPKDWNSKGSIYADQFLAHLCPPEFDDEQRRQFFCILDLRRLKYAANEIFSKKDWKLNVVNFAKEFEKSRSIILLRYGLYEFQNVKPSKEVLKRWRREHGLPGPEDEEIEPTPSKATASKKRKADDELTKDTSIASFPSNLNKRRAAGKEEEEEEEAVAPTPIPNKNKRKASVSGDTDVQPSKLQRATPSATKSLLERIANKSTTTPVGSPVKVIANSIEEASTTTPKPNPFAAASKTNGSGLARSVFQNLKPGNSQPAAGANIFGYLSDASSAKNSGVEADGESETDSDVDGSQEASQSDRPSVAASGAETASQVGSVLFGQKAPTSGGLTAGVSSAPGTRESTPGRSIFERVTKGSDGQPVRAEEVAEVTVAEKPVAPVDQTWNPTTTPLKFAPTSAPTAQASSLFSNTTTPAPSASIFAAKPAISSNIFGAAKQDEPAEQEPTPVVSVSESDKTGGESDKENESQTPKKSGFEPKVPAVQPSFGLFQPKVAETPKEVEAPKPASLFGAAPKSDDKPQAASVATSLFGAVSKPAEPSPTPAAPVMQSSTLFGTRPTEAEKPAAAEAPKPTTSLFGSTSAAPVRPPKPAPTSLFAAQPKTNAGSVFGSVPTAAVPAKPLFGTSSTGNASTAPKKDSAPATAPATAPAAAPAFSFGAASSSGQKTNGITAAPLFGAPKSPTNTNTNSLFGGSPMKQDGPSPVKKPFAGGLNGAASSAPIFSFGSGQSKSAAPIFGGAAPATAPTNGTNSAGPGSFNFNFGGTSSAGSSFNNPFSGGNTGESSGTAPASTSGGMFNFGGNPTSTTTTTTTTTGSTPFQFGSASASTSTPVFGAGSTSATSKPLFGGASGSNGAPGFNFTAASPQPQPGAIFGSNQPAPAFGNLQPPAGGASTTGTNTPFTLGGGSSLATTPAGGTPEPSTQAEGAPGGETEEGEKHEQINLTDGMEDDEEVLHDVRAKVLKFIPAPKADGDDKPKSKSPWSTQGVGPLRLLKHKETGSVRLLLRAEPRGHVALNRSLLPDMDYKADAKYVKVPTTNEKGDGLETWMIQVKTKEVAAELADKLEEHKKLNKK